MLARIGCDVARDGLDRTTIYVVMGSRVWCHGEFRFTSDKGGLSACARELVKCGTDLKQQGASEIHYRIDTTGSSGAGPADALRDDVGLPLRELYGEDNVRVFDVVFNTTRDLRDPSAYANRITELYALVGEMLCATDCRLAVVNPSPELEQDLTARLWEDAYRDGQWVKAIEAKDKFKSRYGRSPDHGDGFVLAVAPPEAFGVVSEIAYPLTPTLLQRCTDATLQWGVYPSTVRQICAGVDGWIAPDGTHRLCICVRAMLPSGMAQDVAYVYAHERPWITLVETLLEYRVPWCVIQAEGDMWAPALDFASRMRTIQPDSPAYGRRTALLRWRGNDARPAWRDKPHKELKLHGDETGYKHVVDWSRAHACNATLERYRDGQIVTPPWGELRSECPVDASGRAEPGLRPSQRSVVGVADVCLGDTVKLHLLRTGFRRGGGVLEVAEPFGGGFAVASALADAGLERMVGG